MTYNSYIYVTAQFANKINGFNMRILKIFQEKLRYKNYSENSINLYASYLKNFLEIINIKDPYQIRTQQIISFLETYQYSSTSQQNQYIGTLKLFAKHILGKKDIHLVKIERPRSEKKLPRVIDSEFIKSKLNQIENLKHRTILTLTFSVGLRVSEIVNLKIEDIDSKRMLIHIKNAKGKKDRIVPLSQTVLELLRQYWKEYRPEHYLFNGQTGQQYSVGSCQKIYKKYIDSNSSIHALRHSAFTALLESGTDLRIIQKIAGHSSSKTTEIYTHVSNQMLNKVVLPI
jgi:site-specific recombinase XerD